MGQENNDLAAAQAYTFEVPEFKIRCSAIGKIMTEPQGKSIEEKVQELLQAIRAKEAKCDDWEDAGKTTLLTYMKYKAELPAMKLKLEELREQLGKPRLSQTCISLLEEWTNQYVYARRSEFSSKYTDKGNKVEDDAIIYAIGYVKDIGLASKNLEKFGDKHIQGSPDIITDTHIFDIKSSWSHDTFPLYAVELPTADYEWQVLGYMALTGKTQGRIIYCLMSMPEELIMKEARWKLGYNYDEALYQEFADAYRYDTLPPYLRIKEFEIQFDQEKIDAIRVRVEQCRQYITNVILPTLEENAKRYTE